MSVRVTIKRVTQVSGAVGLTSSSTNFPFNTTTFRLTYSTILLIIFIILLPIQTYFYEKEETLVESLSNVLWTIMNGIGQILAISCGIYHRKNYQNFLINLNNLLNYYEKKFKKTSLKFYTISLTTIWVFLMSSQIDPWNNIINTIYEEIGLIYLFAIIYQSSVFLLTIKLMLIELDNNLKDNLINFDKRQLEILGLIVKSKKVFHNIFEICSDFNDLVGLVCVWLLLHLMAMVITSGFIVSQLGLVFWVGGFTSWRVLWGALRWFAIGAVSLGFWIWPYTQVSKQVSS